MDRIEMIEIDDEDDSEYTFDDASHLLKNLIGELRKDKLEVIKTIATNEASMKKEQALNVLGEFFNYQPVDISPFYRQRDALMDFLETIRTYSGFFLLIRDSLDEGNFDDLSMLATETYRNYVDTCSYFDQRLLGIEQAANGIRYQGTIEDTRVQFEEYFAEGFKKITGKSAEKVKKR